MIEGFRQRGQSKLAERRLGASPLRMRQHGSMLCLKLCIAALLQLSVAAGGLGQTAPPLSHLRDIAVLTDDQAAHGRPVDVEATVTFVRPGVGNLFVTDSGSSLYVQFSSGIGLMPGDRVRVTGVTQASFRTIVAASRVQFLSHGQMPAPIPASFEDLIAARLDCQYVTIAGRVLSAALDQSDPDAPGSAPGIYLRIQIPHGVVQGYIAHPGSLRPEDLMETGVRIAGVAAGAFDSKMQMAGIWININSQKDIQVLDRKTPDPWSIPEDSLDRVVESYRYDNESKRVRITGVLTYYQPGSEAVVENAGKTMLVETQTALPLRPGQAVEATGFPWIEQDTIRLVDARLRAYSHAPDVTARAIDWQTASTGSHAYDLVAMEGDVVGVVHDPQVDLFILQSAGHLFSASLRHGASEPAAEQAGSSAAPTLGSHVRVVGVCFIDGNNHWRNRLWFDLRMRTADDLTVTRQPSFWNVKSLAYISFSLVVAILASILWAGSLERRVRRQNAIMARQSKEEAIRERNLARQEQQRSRILELISSPAPLDTVLKEICAMVSTRLFEAPCWFIPAGPAGREVVGEKVQRGGTAIHEVTSPDGTQLGFLHADPWPAAPKKADVAATLAVGARLAELAIDTRRLYSDLLHRSEHDLLTELPNRFALEARLDEMIASAARDGGVFGVVYVDLDRFKEVNDQFGHRAGDLYLQAAAGRMRAQMRGGDLLARVGGDEFVALVPIEGVRKDVHEIVPRLLQCFDEPFAVDGYSFVGSASVGVAQFPEDGFAKEDLLRAADSAMYECKQEKPDRHLKAHPVRG